MTSASTAHLSHHPRGLSAATHFTVLADPFQTRVFSATTFMLCAAFTWRATVSWQAVARGEPKLIAALLISSMLVGSVLSVIRLISTHPKK